MEAFAQLIGLGVMALGGFALFAGAVWLVTEFAWSQVQRAKGIHNIVKALRFYGQRVEHLDDLRRLRVRAGRVTRLLRAGRAVPTERLISVLSDVMYARGPNEA